MFGFTARGLVDSLSLVQQLSWSFTCPVYCGSSYLPWVVAGFSFGFLACLLLQLLVLGLFYRHLTPWLVPSPHPGASPSARSLARLRGYLHGREA